MEAVQRLFEKALKQEELTAGEWFAVIFLNFVGAIFVHFLVLFIGLWAGIDPTDLEFVAKNIFFAQIVVVSFNANSGRLKAMGRVWQWQVLLLIPPIAVAVFIWMLIAEKPK